MDLVFPDLIRLFVMVFGNTLDSHQTFLVRLTDSRNLREVSTLNEADFIIAFVPVTSRAGTDIEAALQKIPESKPVVLVVLHHTHDRNYVTPVSSWSVQKADVFTVDCLFHEDQGLLNCVHNDEAVKAVKEHLGEKIRPSLINTLFQRMTNSDPERGRQERSHLTNGVCKKHWFLIAVGVVIFILIIVIVILACTRII